MAHTPDCPRYDHDPSNPACTCSNKPGLLIIDDVATFTPEQYAGLLTDHRPITTAPRDGTWVMVWPRGRAGRRAKWDIALGWVDESGYPIKNPAYWRPE